MAITALPQTLLTAGAANTKGAYAQIVASTAANSSRCYLIVGMGSFTVSNWLIDLATGAAGSETVVVANLAVQTNSSDALVGSFLPISVDIPSGTRLAARCQSTGASGTITIGLYLEDRALGSLVAPVTYGTDLTGSRGTQVDPGGTANTKGAYVQFSASTPSATARLALCICSDTGVIAVATSWKVDVATGAAGSETVILPDLLIVANTFEDSTQPAWTDFPVTIAAGTRVAVRCACTVTSNRILRVTLLGMQEPAASGGGATSVAYLG